MRIVDAPRSVARVAALAVSVALAGQACGRPAGPVPVRRPRRDATAGARQRPQAQSRPAARGFERYDEPKEALEFYARKRAPVGTRAVPSGRYAAARERIAAMPLYSTRAGAFVSPRGRAREGPGAASAPAAPSVGTWGQLGPGNIGGRTRAMVIDPATPATMYAAGVAGGVWKTTNGGSSWTPVGSGETGMENLAVSSLAMKPGAPGTLLAGTGEGFFNLDAVRGAGIFTTTDGGTNWTQTIRPNTGALEGPGNQGCEFHYVNKVVYSVNHADVAYAAVGFSSGCEGSTTGGVYRKSAGSNLWTRILEVTVDGGCLDLALRPPPGTDDVLFASCGTSDPDESTGIFKTNAAATASSLADWTDLTLEDPALSFRTDRLGRTSLAIAPSNPDVIYAIGADFALDDFLVLFKSSGGGEVGTWTEQSTFNDTHTLDRYLFTNVPFAVNCPGFGSGSFNQGWYDNVIAVDPTNANVVWVGGIDLFRSDDGGLNFGLASFWWADSTAPGSASTYAHADQHFLAFSEGSLFVGNDGGIFRSDNPSGNVITSVADVCDPANSGVQFTNLNNGYGVTQFYYGTVMPDDTQYFGGTQDNGTISGHDGGPNSWTEILDGDGGAVAVDPVDPSILYAENTRLSIQKCTQGLLCTASDWTSSITGINDSGFLFIAPFLMDPSAPVDAEASQRLWTGGNFVWRTKNGAASWQKASAKVLGSVSALAVAPSNPNFVLAGTSDSSGGDAGGTIYRTNAGLTVSGAAWPSRKPRSGYVSSLAFDPWDANVAYATYSTFGGVHVWKSTDAGAHWSPLDGTGSNTIPDIPVHSVVVDPTSSSRLYVGTDLGVFVTTDGGVSWAAENTGFGNVVTEQLVVNGANLYGFTHGRGVWRVPLTNATQTALIELVRASSSVTEGDPPTNVVHPVEVRIRTSDHAALGSTATVHWETADGTAKAGPDYLATSGTLTFPAGSTSDEDIQTIDLTIVSDVIGEPTQSFSLNLSNPTGALLARRAHTVTIHDTLTDPPGISVNDITVTEGNVGTTNATFTLSLSGPAKPGTTVTYQTADGSAVAGTDYQAVGPVTVAIPAGAMSKTISIAIFNNTVAQPSRTFFVNLTGVSSPTLATIDDGHGQATIVDNDFSGTIALSSAKYSVLENKGPATIILKRTGGVASGVSVQVQTQDGTASSVSNADFTATATTVAFAAGATTAAFQVPITNDTIDEGPETILLRIFGPTGFGAALGPQQTAILTITDDDVPGQVGFAARAYTVTEGGGIDLNVIRSRGGASAVTVGYTVAGTAVGGLDYTMSPPAPGPLTFAAGEILKTIHVDAIADGSFEGNETVVVTLGPPSGGAVLGAISATTLTVADAEPTFAFTVGQVTVAETAKTLLATVRRTGPLTAPATVDFTTVNGSATGGTNAGDDFLPTAGTLSFPARVATRPITVTLRPDADFEPAEAFSIHLSNPSVGNLGSPSSLTVNIPNDDLGGTFSFAAPAYTVLESKPSVLLTVRRTGGLAPADVTYQTADGTATSPGDYAAAVPTLLHFAAGQPKATIAIPIVQDSIGEGNETFTVTLSAPTAGGALGTPATATVTIQDDDPVVSFGTPTYVVREPLSGTVNLLVPVRRVGPAPAAPFDVTYTATGTATTPNDFSLSPVTPLTFQPTDLVKNLTLTVHADALFEGNETVVLTLSPPSGGAGLGAIPVTTITIIDAQPVISLGAATYLASEPRGTTSAPVTITVRRVGNLSLGSDVNYSITAGTATAGSGAGADFDPAAATPPSTVHFASGQAVALIKVPILPDSEDEPDETFTLTLGAPINGSLGSPSTTTVTIRDNDGAGSIQLAGTQFAVAEGAGAVVVPLTRTKGTAGGASVVCRTANGSASAGSDYTATAQTVTFGPGQTSATCTIPITDDATPGEGAETVLVTLDTPSFGVTIGTPNAGILYILDDE